MKKPNKQIRVENMYYNDKKCGPHVYYIQVQYGQIGMSGTWFTRKTDYENAYKEFLDVIKTERSISIFDENGMGLYIHVGPGMILMFMNDDQYKLIKAKSERYRQAVQNGVAQTESGLYVPSR